MSNTNLLNDISDIVAAALNNNSFDEAAGRLAELLLPENLDEEKRKALLDRALVYSLQAHQPGFPPDGRPGYISSSCDLKEAVLHEVEAMNEVDDDIDVDAPAWRELKGNLEAASESDFRKGADINCPDDYLLVLKPISCGLVLRERGIRL